MLSISKFIKGIFRLQSNRRSRMCSFTVRLSLFAPRCESRLFVISWPQTMLAMCAGLGMRAFVGLLTSPLPVSSPVPSSFCGRCCKFSDCSLQSAEALHRCLQPSIPISLRFAYKIEWPAIDHHLRSGAKKGKTTPHLAYVCIDQHCQRSLSHVNQMVNFRLCPSIKSTIMIYL